MIGASRKFRTLPREAAPPGVCTIRPAYFLAHALSCPHPPPVPSVFLPLRAPRPAGVPLAYAQCCGRYVDDFEHTPAPDAESLMRSRYTAFVRERADYLLATWHATTRPATSISTPA